MVNGNDSELLLSTIVPNTIAAGLTTTFMNSNTTAAITVMKAIAPFCGRFNSFLGV